MKYRIFQPITRALSIQKGSEIGKNEHARYTLEGFLTDINTKNVHLPFKQLVTREWCNPSNLSFRANGHTKVKVQFSSWPQITRWSVHKYKHNVTKVMCTLYIRCALSVLQKKCRKVWGARYTLGARYRSENMVISSNGHEIRHRIKLVINFSLSRLYLYSERREGPGQTTAPEISPDRMSHTVLWHYWCGSNFLKAHAPTKDRNDDSKDGFYDQLQQVFDQFPKHSTRSSVRRF